MYLCFLRARLLTKIEPFITEMVEPVEETRTEVTFATEPLLSSLQLSIPGSRTSPLVELDEVEVCTHDVVLLYQC